MNITNIIIHAVFWLFGFFILWKIPYCIKTKNKKEVSVPSISVIIPARNEEMDLPNLLSSLNNSSIRVKEVIVVDDSSTDATYDIAKKYGSKVIRLKNLPKGWLGKSWACYNGARIATGDYLIFFDADTILEEDGIEKIFSHIKKDRGVISIQPYHRIKRAYENLSLFFNIILIAGMGAFTILQTKIRPIGTFGPCLICKKTDYEKIEGHESIKGKIMEDIEIGKKFLKEKIPLSLYGGKGTINFRMYSGGLKELITGWSKGFSSGAKSTSIPVLIMVIAWIAGAIFPINLFIRGSVTFDPATLIVASTFYIAFIFQIYWMSYRIGNFNFWASLLYFIPMIFFIVVFLYSIIITIFRRRVSWKGRQIKT
jgi:4,4'-diaponeurosporenoate glycosyltransferase